ncbi:MAG: chloride channel protein [Acidobacteriota bacterium]
MNTDSRSLPSVMPRAMYRLAGLCLLVGVCGGVAAVLFDGAVRLTQAGLLGGIAGYWPPQAGVLHPTPVIPQGLQRWWLPLVTALGGLISGVIVYRWAPEAEGHGTDAAIAAYHQHGGTVRYRIPFVKAIASALTIGSGGVAGKEGPTAQISVGIGAMLAGALGLRGQERRILLLAGMAAGLAAIFKAPLGMAIFSVEILYSGMVFESEALIYTVIASVSAYAVHGFYAGWSPIFAIPQGLTFHQPLALLGFAVLGCLAGLIGAGLPSLFYWQRDLFRRLPLLPHFRPAIGGLLVGLIAVAFPAVLGTGYGWVELALAENLPLTAMLLYLLLRGPAMSLTIGSGGSGGVFGPVLSIGAMLGGVVGWALGALAPAAHLEPASFVLVGMAAVFAGAARTPISTLIMVAEMTGGYGLIVPTMLANIIAFLVARSLTEGRSYPTLYESQVDCREDSPIHRGVFVRRAFQMLEGGAVSDAQLTLPRLVSLLQLGEPISITGRHEMLVQLRVAEGSSLSGRTVREAFAELDGATAVAVLRGEEMLVPRGPTCFEAGDQVIVVTTGSAYEQLQKAVASPPSSA